MKEVNEQLHVLHVQHLYVVEVLLVLFHHLLDGHIFPRYLATLATSLIGLQQNEETNVA